MQTPVAVVMKEGKQTEGNAPSEIKATWQGPNGAKVDESKLQSLLAILSDLKCNKYIYGKEKKDLVDHLYVVELKSGRAYILPIFPQTKEDDHNHPAASSENNHAFELSDWKAKKTMIPLDDILAKLESKKVS